MTQFAAKLARMKALAESVGAQKVATATSRRPVNQASIAKRRALAEQTVQQEFLRIVDVPIWNGLSEEDIEAMSLHYFQQAAYDKGYRLYKEQAEAIYAYSNLKGAFCPIAVGGGKTLASLLIANDAYMNGEDKVMLLVPSSLATQLCDSDIRSWRPLTIFNMPIHRLTGLTPVKRKRLAKSNRRGLYVFSYDLLSRDYEVLEDVSPGLIILDEAHSVTKRSARTKRFNRYLHAANPDVVALSGTMTQKALSEYFELARASLKRNNFLPNSVSLTEEWSRLIDVTASGASDYRAGREARPGPLRHLVDWAISNFPDESFEQSVVGFRKVFQTRLETTPGVICSSGDALPYSLYIHNDPVKNPEKSEGWGELRRLVRQLENDWLTPNGDEIEEAMHLFRWKYWIEGAGFYTQRYWPTVEKMMEKGKYSYAAAARSILERSQAYHEVQMDYHRELRKWITNNATHGLDTPMLIGLNMTNHGAKNVTQKLFDKWRTWKDAEFDGRIERLKRAVRVCDFKVVKAVEWAKKLPKTEGGLIWYDNEEMGNWVSERLEAAGVDHLHCKAGSQYNTLLNDKSKCKGKVIVLTINAHYQGKNLQFDRNQFYLQWPRSAARAEQAIGRQHRKELEYDEVFVTTCNTTEFDMIMYAASLNDAAYVHQSQGNKQKIIYASYDPKPSVVPFEVLLQWGADPKRLNQEGEDVLQNAFGKRG